MSANLSPYRIMQGILTITGTSANGSTNILVLKTSSGTTVAAVNTAGTVTLSSGIIGKTITITNTYTIQSNDDIIICNSTTGFTVNLPVAVIGQIFTIKNIGAGNIVVDAYSSDTIDGQLTQTVAQWNCMTIQCYAANTWLIR